MDEEISEDISKLEDMYHEQVVSDCEVKSLSLSLNSVPISMFFYIIHNNGTFLPLSPFIMRVHCCIHTRCMVG